MTLLLINLNLTVTIIYLVPSLQYFETENTMLHLFNVTRETCKFLSLLSASYTKSLSGILIAAEKFVGKNSTDCELLQALKRDNSSLIFAIPRNIMFVCRKL